MQPYLAGKGTLKFPVDQPVPYDLIAKITEAHMKRLMPDSPAAHTEHT
jgi:uncharacterized protein YdhG (YjbR/CyaY superfamily)